MIHDHETPRRLARELLTAQWSARDDATRENLHAAGEAMSRCWAAGDELAASVMMELADIALIAAMERAGGKAAGEDMPYDDALADLFRRIDVIRKGEA